MIDIFCQQQNYINFRNLLFLFLSHHTISLSLYTFYRKLRTYILTSPPSAAEWMQSIMIICLYPLSLYVLFRTFLGNDSRIARSLLQPLVQYFEHDIIYGTSERSDAKCLNVKPPLLPNTACLTRSPQKALSCRLHSRWFILFSVP